MATNSVINANQLLATSSSPSFTAVTGGNLNLANNALISSNTNGNINVLPNGAGITLIGTNTVLSGQTNIFQVALAGNRGTAALCGFTNDINPPSWRGYKSRSTTINSFVAVQSGDQLMHFSSYADDGTQYTAAGSIAYVASGAVSAGVVPTLLDIRTANTSGSLVTAITVSNAQVVTLANALPVGSGGIGITTTPSNGFLPIGNGTNYTAAAITPGAGINVTNGSGSITISSIGGGLGWTAASSTPITAAINIGYYITDASQVTITLPVTAAAGSIVRIAGQGAGGWILAPGSGQTINVNGTSASTSITSGGATDCIEVICVVANTTWNTLSYVTKVGFTVS